MMPLKSRTQSTPEPNQLPNDLPVPRTLRPVPSRTLKGVADPSEDVDGPYSSDL